MTTREPLSPNTLLVVIDMQRLFAEETAWHTPSLHDILPAVTRLAAARPERTLFARFVTPQSADAATGRWRTYYRRWSSVTGDLMPPGLLELVAPLAGMAQEGAVFDKPTYSVFGAADFEARLTREDVDTLIFAGVETDVCVLASVFDAVDGGFRVIVAADAVASSSQEGHAAVIKTVLLRMNEQVEVMDVDAILDLWR